MRDIKDVDSLQYLEKWSRQRNTLENQLPYIEACHQFEKTEILKDAINAVRLDIKAYDYLTREFLFKMCDLESKQEGQYIQQAKE